MGVSGQESLMGTLRFAHPTGSFSDTPFPTPHFSRYH